MREDGGTSPSSRSDTNSPVGLLQTLIRLLLLCLQQCSGFTLSKAIISHLCLVTCGKCDSNSSAHTHTYTHIHKAMKAAVVNDQPWLAQVTSTCSLLAVILDSYITQQVAL